jgi:septal ring factor EnvC (AmiA/AmiB activator)
MKRAAFPVALLTLFAHAAAQEPASRAEELQKIEQALKERLAEETRLKNDAFEREKEVAALRYRMIETANALQESERRMREISRELERLTAEEASMAGALRVRQGELSDVLVALQSLELARPPALLISPSDANKAARAAILLSDAAPKLAERARTLRVDLESLRAVRVALDEERAAFEKTSAEIDSRRNVLAALLKRKQSERDVAQKLAAAAQRETAALASRATDLREVVRRLRRLARAITPRLKPAPRDREAPAAPPILAERKPDAFAPARAFAKSRGSLRPPVVGRLVARFGSALPGGGKLEGVRFAARDEAVVTAPYESSVVFARQWNPVGNLIVLDAGGGYHILLIGVSIFLVQEGQKVASGEPVAAMGAEGGQEANLDLEIRRNGEPVDPALWLSRKSIEEMAF